MLREAAEPVATHEVVRRLMAERGQDVEDRRLVKQTMKRVGMELARQEKQSTVYPLREVGQSAMWRIAS